MRNTHLIRLVGVIFVSLVVVAASGCSTVPMDPKKPIESRKGLFGPMYWQENENLDLQHMERTLKELPASKDSAQKHSTYKTLGLVTGIPGGFMVGWYLGTELGGREGNKTLLYAGVPLTVLSLAFDIIAQNHLEDAIDAHNKSTSKASANGVTWTPVLATSGDSLTGGVSLGF